MNNSLISLEEHLPQEDILLRQLKNIALNMLKESYYLVLQVQEKL